MTPPVPLIFLWLVVPTADDTASPAENVYPSWSENIKTCGLVPGRILWFRNFYLPDEIERIKWDNSPTFAPNETFQKVPNTWIGLCECDILRDEGVFYGEKLRKFGKKVEAIVYPNAPHAILAVNGEQTLIP
jgi:acetyl esterase/lipase